MTRAPGMCPSGVISTCFRGCNPCHVRVRLEDLNKLENCALSRGDDVLYSRVARCRGVQIIVQLSSARAEHLSTHSMNGAVAVLELLWSKRSAWPSRERERASMVVYTEVLFTTEPCSIAGGAAASPTITVEHKCCASGRASGNIKPFSSLSARPHSLHSQGHTHRLVRGHR